MLRYRLLVLRAAQVLPGKPLEPDRTLGFFILSSGRSGSTLLRRMLHAHPAVSIPPESEDLLVRCLRVYLEHRKDHRALLDGTVRTIQGMDCMGAWGLDTAALSRELGAALTGDGGFPACYSAIYRAYARSHKPTAWLHGDKTPLLVYYLDLVHRLFPQAHILFLVRHPVDVVGSMVAMGLKGGDIGTAIGRWNSAARILLDASRKPFRDKVMMVRYEDLVTAPDPVLRSVCGRLGIGYDPAMVEDRAHDLGDTGLGHHAAVHRPVTTLAIGKWGSRLDPGDKARIVSECGPLAAKLGYDL